MGGRTKEYFCRIRQLNNLLSQNDYCSMSIFADSPYVMRLRNGKPIDTFTVNAMVDSIIKKSGLHHISPHGLRHTHAILLLESGANLKVVSDRLGHTIIAMTANVYLHITKKYEDENIQRFSAFLD